MRFYQTSHIYRSKLVCLTTTTLQIKSMKFAVVSSLLLAAASSCYAFVPSAGLMRKSSTIMMASRDETSRRDALGNVFRSLAFAGLSTALLNGASSPVNAKDKLEYLQEPTPVSTYTLQPIMMTSAGALMCVEDGNCSFPSILCNNRSLKLCKRRPWLSKRLR